MGKGEAELVREVILMTNSEYVARRMNAWVWRWERSGCETSGREEVKNKNLLVRLHEIIKGLEEQDAVNVRFWRVSREWNEVADAMVNQVLDGYLRNMSLLRVH
jgi:ribonuclease HI